MLTATVAVNAFGLIVKADLLRRERRNDARVGQRLRDAREYAVLRIQFVRQRRPGPPTRTPVDGEPTGVRVLPASCDARMAPIDQDG